MTVGFGVLGPLQVMRDGHVQHTGGPKRRALLADLLLHANSVVSVERLIDDLWGDDPPDTATNTVQVHVAALRRVLGAEAQQVLLTVSPGYLLKVEEHAFDLFQFEALITQARNVQVADPAAALTALSQAIGLWRGPALGDLASNGFLVPEVARLEEARAAAIEDLADVQLTLGRHEDAMGHLRRLIADHPLRERPRRLLMLALYRAGCQTEALEGYRLFRNRMVEELGIEPGSGLRDMEAAILQHDRSLDLAVGPRRSEPVEPAAPSAPDPVKEPVAVADAEEDEERKVVTVAWYGIASRPGPVVADVEDLSMRSDRRHSLLREVVEAHGGTVELVAGDTVLVLFGVPAAHEDDPLRAVRASLALSRQFAADGEASAGDVKVRVGIATGEALVRMDGLPRGESRVAGDVLTSSFHAYESCPDDGIMLADGAHHAVSRWFHCERYPDPGTGGGGSAAPLLWRVRGPRRALSGHDVLVAPRSVGREEERVLVASMLARCVHAGLMHLVTVLASPGLGKTRLVHDLAEQVSASGDQVLWLEGRCAPYGRQAGLSVLSEVVKRYCGIHDDDDQETAAQKLDRAIPPDHRDAPWLRERLRPLVGVEGTAVDRQESFSAWQRFLEMVAAGRPTVVVLEDLHWADQALLDFIEHFAGYACDVPMLLLCTARPELYDRDPHWATALPNSTRIDLGPLPREVMRELVSSALPSPDPLLPVVDAVLSRAGGNPLFAVEFLRLLLDEHLLAKSRAGWQLAATERLPVPWTVHDTIAARVDALPLGRKRLLHDAAVVGEFFWPGALAAVSRYPRGDVDHLLHELSRGGWVRQVTPSSMSGESEYAFHHSLVRDVCYEELPREQRAARHERAASWIEALAPGDRRIGHHLVQAFAYRKGLGELDATVLDSGLRGARLLLPEWESALQSGDRRAAARAADVVLGVLIACPSDVLMADLSTVSATTRLLVRMGRWGDVVTLLSRQAEVKEPGLIRDLGVALCQLHKAEPLSQPYREGQRLLELAASGPEPDADALSSLAGTYKGVDDARAHQLYRRCLQFYPDQPYALGNVLEYEVPTGGAATIVEMRDHVVAAHERCLSQLASGENLPWAWFDAGKLAALLGRPDESLASYAKAVQLTTAEHMLATTLTSLTRLASCLPATPCLGWAATLLALARAAMFSSEGSLRELFDAEPLPLVGDAANVVMMEGEDDPGPNPWFAQHAEHLLEAFAPFRGLVVSSATTSGVAEFTGALRDRYGERIAAVGYLPSGASERLPLVTRYDDLRRTPGPSVSVAENLRAWSDLVVSGVGAARVKVLAFNGGGVAAAEYRIALALGARVGVLAGSGGEADRLLRDPDWCRAPNLIRLDPDVSAVQRFLES